MYTEEQPNNLNYITSTNGSTWTAATTIRTFPFADAQWDVAWDGTHLHIAKNISTGDGVAHQGLEYRRGVPNADGTITWDADWQTAIATPNSVGDLSVAVGTDGKVWVGYNNAGAGPGGNVGDACVIKNAALDGTWVTDDGFPVALTDTNDCRFAIVASLPDGAMYVVVYKWGTDIPATGYISDDGSASFDSEGDITTSNIEASAYVAAAVGRIEAASLGDGEIHLAYQTDQAHIIYRKRNSLGAWGDEVDLSINASAVVSSPRISFDENGDIYLTWTNGATQTIYIVKREGDTWADVRNVWSEPLEISYEHLMPAEHIYNSRLIIANLTDNYELKTRLIDVSALGPIM